MVKKKKLWIAGHGLRKNGTYDAGATGIVGGEHKYVKEQLFPAMKKYADDSHVFFDEYNVFSHGNIVDLARRYNAEVVTEVHYDAFNGKAQGGHVIVFSGYAPDAMDLRLRDAIDSMVGLRFSHKGHKGISGRNNLANVNRTANAGIDYRMLELGFGDNPRDAKILIDEVDAYAKKLVEAVQGGKVTSKPDVPQTKPSAGKSDSQLSFDEVVDKTIAGSYGSQPHRENNIRTRTNFSYEEIQEGVNRKLRGATSKPSKLNFDTVVNNVIDGTYGNGQARFDKIKSLGHDPAKVQAEVNKRLLGRVPAKPKPKPAPVKPKWTTETVAQQIAKGVGGWGNGQTRVKHIKNAGLNPTTVQNRVNAILGSKGASAPSVNIESLAKQVVKGVDSRGRRIPNGVNARARHFGISVADMNKVQARVNQILR